MTHLKHYLSAIRHALLPATVLIIVSASLGIATNNPPNSKNSEADKAPKPVWVGADRYKIGNDLYVCFTEDEKKLGKCRKIYVVPPEAMRCGVTGKPPCDPKDVIVDKFHLITPEEYEKELIYADEQHLQELKEGGTLQYLPKDYAEKLKKTRDERTRKYAEDFNRQKDKSHKN